MPVRTSEVSTHHVLAGESRQALLAVLREQARALDAGEAGAAVGLHRNTARFHLDMLVKAGFVTRQMEQRTFPGRPRVLYEVALDGANHPGALSGVNDYRGLARVLAEQLAQLPDTKNEAIRAGRRWAASLDRNSMPDHPLAPSEAIKIVTTILDDLGFKTEAAPDGGTDRIMLCHCPFAEVARENRSIVCGIHLGMLRATFESLDTTLEVAGLDSFVTDDPMLCVVRLTTKEPEPGASMHQA
jgi:predicted ArsR family transcriptional regulator